MATQVEVCNAALTQLGAGLISAITENSKAAIRLRAIWDETRDYMLTRHRWGFARAQVALALVSGAEVAGWTYVYALPSACLEAREIYQANPDAPPVPFERGVSSDLTADYILTDLEGAELVYTARVVETPRWPMGFAKAVSWELADRVCMALTGDLDLKKWAATQAERAFLMAANADANQQVSDLQRPTDWHAARA